MGSKFPTALPGAKTDYDNADNIDSAGRNAQNEDINAIAAKLGHGTDDNLPGTNKILRGTASGKSEWDFDILDENDMVSDSDTALPTQKSTKAYVDSIGSDLTTHESDTTTHGATGAVVGATNTQILTNKTTIQKVTSYTPAGAATATLNLTTGNIHKITMPTGNITIAISNEAVGQCFMIEITQDGVGSRTVTWFTTIRWMDGAAPTLTTTASKRDIFGFRVTGVDTYDGFIVGQNI